MSERDSVRDVLRLGTDLEELSRLYPWLDAAAAPWGWPADFMNGMHVALEEAVMNVAMHAYPPGEPGQITVRLRVSDPVAALVVEDEGPPFNPVIAPAHDPHARVMGDEAGGLGLTLMRHFCKDISYERADGCNRLTLRFPRPGRG